MRIRLVSTPLYPLFVGVGVLVAEGCQQVRSAKGLVGLFMGDVGLFWHT